jgi:hypothetical protein
MRWIRGGSLVIASHLLLAATHRAAAQVPAATAQAPVATADSAEMPPASTLVRFWARSWAGGQWHVGRVGTIMDSRQVFCPMVRSDGPAGAPADSLAYLVRGIDSLQVVDSAAARAGRPLYRTVAMAPIKARYGSCGVP